METAIFLYSSISVYTSDMYLYLYPLLKDPNFWKLPCPLRNGQADLGVRAASRHERRQGDVPGGTTSTLPLPAWDVVCSK